jgi:hypothetical protein
VGVGISAFELTGIYFSTPTKCLNICSPVLILGKLYISSVERVPPKMALVCVIYTSVTTLQDVLPNSAEPSLSSLNTVLHSETYFENITASILL